MEGVKSAPERKVLKTGPPRENRGRKRFAEEDEEEEEVEENKTPPSIQESPKQQPMSLPWILILYLGLAVVLCSLAASMVTFYHRDRILHWFAPPIKPVFALDDDNTATVTGVVAEAAFNTTTVQILYDARLSLALHLAKHRATHTCLCMHQLRIPSNVTRVRACAVLNDFSDQLYFMRNPRLIGYNKGAAAYDVLETCNGQTRLRKRATQLYVEWEDEKDVTHYAQFRQETAFCLQRVIEEFQGKCL